MQLPRPGFELGATSSFPMTLTITPRASGKINTDRAYGMNNVLKFEFEFLKIQLGCHRRGGLKSVSARQRGSLSPFH